MHEKREHPRTPVNTDVTCEIEGYEPFGGICRDISLGGMFIEAEVAPSFGTKLNVTCRLPGINTDATLPGIVRWVKPGGFGVQFGLLGARETHAITGILRDRS